MASFYLKAGGSLAILVVLAAVYYKKDQGDELKDQIEHVLSGLLRAEKKVPLPAETKVAVGFGSCLDVVADGLDTLEQLGANPPDIPEHFNEVSNREELEKLFAYFYRHGAAAE